MDEPGKCAVTVAVSRTVEFGTNSTARWQTKGLLGVTRPPPRWQVRGPVGPTCVYTDRSEVHGAATCYAKLTVCQTHLSVFVQQPVDPISAADIIHSALSQSLIALD